MFFQLLLKHDFWTPLGTLLVRLAWPWEPPNRHLTLKNDALAVAKLHLTKNHVFFIKNRVPQKTYFLQQQKHLKNDPKST